VCFEREIEAGPAVDRIAPDPVEEFQVKPLGTSVGLDIATSMPE
jgi:hypothetical protein